MFRDSLREQIPLAAVASRRPRRAESRRVEARMLAAAIEPQPARCDREALFEECREFPRAAHSRSERGVVVAPATHLTDEAHDVGGAKREMRIEPLAKERCDFARQAHEHPPGGRRTIRGGRAKN